MKRVRLKRKPGNRSLDRKVSLRSSPETAREMRERAARKRAGRPRADRSWGEGRPRAACPVCAMRMVWDPHHVLYQKHIRARARLEKWSAEQLRAVLSDVRNRLWVCSVCNQEQEHGPNRPMRRAHVPASAWEFARTLGEWAVVRLERDYPV